MAWYTKLQNKLSQSNTNYEEVFYESASELMNNYILVVKCQNGQKRTYEFTELEYYFFDALKHPDFYTHRHCLQLECNKFYVHEMGLDRSGIDLTFGNCSYFGGILIRGLYDSKRNHICGPAICCKNIKDNIDYSIDAYHKLQKHMDCLSIVPKNENMEHKILKSTRYGIKESICDKEHTYLTKLYRFIREDYFFAKDVKVKEKTKIKICNHPLINAYSEKAAIKKYREAHTNSPDYILWQKICTKFKY